jgi:hypothetical protein
MRKQTQLGQPRPYPHVFRWVAEFGTLEIGQGDPTNSFIRALDGGGMVWKGRRRYPSLDAALADAEDGVATWMRHQLGIRDAD